MSITVSQLIGMVQIQGAKESVGQLVEMGVATDAADVKLKNLAVGGVLVAGAALVGIGAKSVKMAGDFEQSTNLLITSANEVPKNIDMIRSGLLKMSVDTATSTDQLVKGMFNIESAGYHGAEALKVEKAAAEGAKVENADLAATTDTLTTAMHNYHEPASQAVDVMNSFRMAASIGKMHMDDLTGALKNVLPIASQAGVSLTDVEAALSTMSLAGDKGASAGTHLSQMLTYLLAPSSKATAALKEVGLTTQEISDEMKVSLPGAVQMITDAVGEKFPVGSAKYIAALSAIVGGNKSMKAMLELSGISLKTFTEDAKQLGPTMTANSTAVDGWTTVQSNFNFKMEAAKNAVEALMISVGTKLLPVVGQLADAVTPLIQGFSAWVTAGANVGDQLGVLQPAFQSIRDILPDIGTFLTRAGDDIGQYLLPPLASLATNVGQVVSDFSTWMDKSGTAKSAIADLGTAVGITAQVVGTLVQGLSDLIGWFDQDAPQAYILAGAVTALGLAFAGLKVANTVAGLQQMITKFADGESIFGKLADTLKTKVGTAFDDFTTKQFPNLKKSMNGVTEAADAAAEAEVKVATATSGKASSQAWFADLEGSLGDVENKANAAATAEETVGTTAETTMASKIAVGSAESEASLGGIKVAAGEAAVAEETIGTTAETKMAGGVEAGAATSKGALSGMGGMLGGLILTIALMGNEWAYSAVSGKSFFDQVSRGDWLGSLATFVALGTPGGQLAKTIDIFNQLPTAFSKITGGSQDMTKKVTANTTTMKTQSVQSITEMAQGITGEYSWMKNESLNTVQGFTSDAIKILGKMGTDGANIMQSLDKSTQLYWNDIANYINMKSNEAAMDANQNFEKIHHVTIGIGKNFNDPSQTYPGHASGTSYSPGGIHWLGENEPELVVGRQTGYVPQGASVIPMSHMQGGLGGGGNNQPIHVHVHIADQEFEYLTNAMMQNAMQQSILQFGRKVF